MVATIEFKNKIISWLRDNGCTNVEEIKLTREFTYCRIDKTINIGIVDQPTVGTWFEDFLLDNGCEYENIPYPLLAFLHEVGHSQTIENFNEEELTWCSLMKESPVDPEDKKYSVFKYWKIPDEWAANEWLINFVNQHITAVANLWTDIFIPLWEKMLDEDNVWEIVQEKGEV